MISFFICLFLLMVNSPKKYLDRMTAARRQSPWKMALTMFPWEPPVFS